MVRSPQQDDPALGIADPARRDPLCDEEVFARVLDRMVADNAPRLFAVVAEYGDRVDVAIAA